MHFCLSRVGFFIGRWPLHVFLLNLAVVLPILSYFLVYPISVDTDVRRGFAHKNGRSTQEFQVFGDFYNVSVSELELLLLFVGSKNKSENVQMELTSHLLNEVDRLNDFVKELSVPSKNGILKFSDLETSRGDINFLYHAFKFGWNVQTDNLKNNRSLDSDFDLGFPTTNFMVTIFLWKRTSLVFNYTMSRIKYMQVQSIHKSDNFSSAFSFHIYGDEVVNHEMMMGSERTLKLLTVGMFLMIVFMMLALRDLPFKTRILIIAAAISSPF
uniref:Uncharacterized protein n=1 Tax=Ditylenchus dipsaci TaxID=166011 RepID=A0A915DFC1_9BILA